MIYKGIQSRGRLVAPAASAGCLDLQRLHAEYSDPAQLLQLLKSQIRQADELLAQRFWAQDYPVNNLISARAWVVEQLLLKAWYFWIPGSAEFSLLALGGFGRGELHPHSDVDLLIVTADGGINEAEVTALESLVSTLWDAGFFLGHSVRSVAEAVADAGADVKFATNLMESRLLSDRGEQFTRLHQAIQQQNLWPAPAFFRAKYREQQERHAQYHDTGYNLEPNIKEGPGGLRDIQMISWTAKRHFQVNTVHGLVEHGYFTEPLYQKLMAGQQFLWRVRYALHLLAGRAEDRLLFDFQRQIADRFGYTDEGTRNRGVERFMQHYFRTITQLERLNDQLLELLEEALEPAGEAVNVSVLDQYFQSRNGYLELRNRHLFVEQPLTMLRLFLTLQRNPELKGATAQTLRLLRQHQFLLDRNLCAGEQAGAIFLQLLGHSEGVYTQLQRMNRWGVLAHLIPAFEKIVGRMQFDLFHVYTVDQHILFTIRNLRRFAYGKYLDRFPHGQQVFHRIEKPELLYLAALFHDIAKGREGDHSELGAVDAAEFCRQLGLAPVEQRLVEWLVEQHLLMSYTAQRKDISDPDTVNAFANQVGDQRHLDNLYLLTMADIAATSPKLWNTWKDSLLWELYQATSHALRQGLEQPLDRDQHIQEVQTAALQLLQQQGFSPSSVSALWDTLPRWTFLRFSDEQLSWCTGEVLNRQGRAILVSVRAVTGKGMTEVFIHAPDSAGLFATITRTLDSLSLNVLAARIITSDQDHSFDLFQVMDAHNQPLNESDMARLQRQLQQGLAQPDSGKQISRPIPRRLQHFIDRTLVDFATEPVQGLTLMELECTDRPGLLSQVAEAFVSEGVRVHDARIATFGDHVEDTFLLSSDRGEALTAEQQQRLSRAIHKRLEQQQDLARASL